MNLLFATVLDGAGAEVSTTTVAQALSDSLGRGVEVRDIEVLRQPGAGRTDDDLLDGLARYFDMPESFLSDYPEQYYSSFLQLSLLIVQRDKRIPFVALRLSSDRVGDNGLHELKRYLESLG
ncbi:hypothetical protein [Nocardia sp. CC227C]|uniref:hypothetical protein n=1 Tax=Nocardia sp. CC227C TaxID=3044562 RepID=UPI00278BFF04|nr:hypothetical protein [Nocardia sp. CC227C]